MLARNSLPQDNTLNPGPAAYNVDQGVWSPGSRVRGEGRRVGVPGFPGAELDAWPREVSAVSCIRSTASPAAGASGSGTRTTWPGS